MGDVVSPLPLTYNGTSHQWLTRGLNARRTFPTICDHMCSVAYVSAHSDKGRAGQFSDRSVPPLVAHMSVFLPSRRYFARSLFQNKCVRFQDLKPFSPLTYGLPRS